MMFSNTIFLMSFLPISSTDTMSLYWCIPLKSHQVYSAFDPVLALKCPRCCMPPKTWRPPGFRSTRTWCLPCWATCAPGAIPAPRPSRGFWVCSTDRCWVWRAGWRRSEGPAWQLWMAGVTWRVGKKWKQSIAERLLRRTRPSCCVNMQTNRWVKSGLVGK